jgi:hypothetical protein
VTDYRSSAPPDERLRVRLSDADVAPCRVVGPGWEATLDFAARTNRSDGRGPVEALYTLDAISPREPTP